MPALTIPNCPPHTDADSITLREARDRGYVTHNGGRVDLMTLRRWCSKGCRILAGGQLYLFPSVRSGRERLTTRARCEAWTRFVEQLRGEAARAQAETLSAVRQAARK